MATQEQEVEVEVVVVVTQVELVTIITETQRIISGHSRHFLGLALFFLLLPSFSLSVFPSLLFSSSSSSSSQTFLSLPFSPNPLPSFILPLSLFSLFLFSFSLLSTASITRSVLHAFYGRPVRLLPALLSSFPPLFPLLVTSFLSQFLLFAFAFLSASSLFFLFKGIQLLGLSPSPYIMVPFAALSLAVVIFLVYFQVNWSLSSVVVVAESSWGLKPLKRSRFLVQGTRRVALCIFLFSRILVAVLIGVSLLNGDESGSSSSSSSGGGGGNKWWSWVFVVRIVVSSALLMVLFLYYVAGNTVLYMYCKAARGELEWEIAEEFAGDYVSLPFDHHKVPRVVSMVYP